MPASFHPLFLHPDDGDAAIWRYMDFTKYVSMLQHKGLYMCRSDRLDDPFEGSVPPLFLERERAFFLGGGLPGLWKEAAERMVADRSTRRRTFRRLIYLNCWYVNPHESKAMWSLYGNSTRAIAIKSSFTNLFNRLPADYFVGLIRYADYDTEAIESGNMFFPFLYKRKSFEHERELRILHLLPPEEGKDFFERETPEGSGRRLI